MKKYLVLLLLLNTLYCKAQPAQLKFDHFTVKDGLPETTVMFMQQDDQGYIWVGTRNGLMRYDGYKPKIYRPGIDKYSITSNCEAVSMVTGENKNLWFSTRGNGIFRYDRADDNFIQYKYPQKAGEKKEIAQQLDFADDKGNLWGTSNKQGEQPAIVKFNSRTGGYEFFGLTQKGDRYLNAQSIHVLFQSADAAHHIWAGTNTGLYEFSQKDNAFHSYPGNKNPIAQSSIYNVNEAPSERGILWANAINNNSKRTGIFRIDTRDNTFKDFSHADNRLPSASNDSISDVYEDRQRRLWFASNNGLMLFNRKAGTFSNYLPIDTDKAANKNQFYGIKEGKDGSLWLLSDEGLLNFDPVTHQFQRFTANLDDPDALSGNAVGNVLIDSSGTLWVVIPYGSGMGIDKLDRLRTAFTSFTKKNTGKYYYPLSSSCLHSKSSADGYLWFTNHQGLFKWKPGTSNFKQIIKATPKDGNPFALTIGTEGRLYFGNLNGVNVYDTLQHKLQQYSFNPKDSTSVSSNIIEYIMQDHTGLVWIGTRDKGVCTFNPANHQFKRYPFSWADGFDTGQGKLDGNWVITIYEDKQGEVWIGTVGGGLSRFDRKTGTFKSFLFDGQIQVKTVIDIFEDSGGNIWAGTYLDGLFEFDPKNNHFTRHIGEENGLLFNEVTGINQDDKGFLWLCSGRGLTRLNPTDMAIKNFPLDTILPGSRLTYRYNLKKINGQMVMSLTNGFAVFNPADLADNIYRPIVHIEKVGTSNPASTADSVSTRFTYGRKNLELPYNQNRITFSYVALDYANPAQNKYAYLLYGYDKHWVQAGTQRSVTYTNLVPGTYTFRVKACNSDGVWNNKGDSFLIIINPPWWQRWWAYVLYVILAAAAIYAFVAYRTRKLVHDKLLLEEQVQIRTDEVLQQKEEIEAQRDHLEMEKIRSTIAADFHDELGSTLSSIALYSEMAMNDTFSDEQRIKGILSLIGESSRGTVSAMQDMIWAIQPKNDKMQEVIYRMREYAYPLAELKGISLVFEADEEIQGMALSMDTRKTVYLVFKEALNNIFKYAAASHIIINITKQGSLLCMQINDNGKGFDINGIKPGNGLANMHKRAEQAGGTIAIKSNKGFGTEILFSCPLG